MKKIEYTNLLPSIIVLGIIGINFHLFKGELISVVYAVETHFHYSF